jgi:hypothetical protein
MKKPIASFLSVIALVLGVVIGYLIGFRRGHEKTGDDMVRGPFENSQLAAQCEARGYLYSLQALDSGRVEDIAAVRQRALSHLRVYVSGVEDLRRMGYEWSPNQETFSNATAYLAKHPREK